MKRSGRRWPVLLGLALCALTLMLSVALQREGYLVYLNSDMSSEMILARQQADSGHLVETQWLYSTEVHTLHMNLLYALSFLFTDSFFLARVIGNTLGFLLGMAALLFLCRELGLSTARALCTAALLPLAAGTLYAANMTVGGYYIVHLPFAFLGAGLWLRAARRARRRGRGLLLLLGFMALCALEGFLSVRYVLCFLCPMFACGVLDAVFAPEQDHTLSDGHARFFKVTMLGFGACLAGYALSEIVVPRVFMSGTGAASSFRFNPLDGGAMLASLATVAADCLKLLGWRGGAALFSPAGIVNLCVAGVLVLGGMMTVRVYRGLAERDAVSCAQKRLLRYAGMAFLVNLFCFVCIEGTYLNRYLILAVLLFIPALAVVLAREKNRRLLGLFCLLFCVGIGGSGVLLLRETHAQAPGAQARGQDMMDAAAYLTDAGYTHGYGTFWNVRVMQERTQGALTFTGVTPEETEEGAVCAVSPGFIRWLEMDACSDLDICTGRTFLLLTQEERGTLSDWLAMAGAPLLYENGTFAVYGFASSQAFSMAVLEGTMTLEGTVRAQDGAYDMQAGGRLRIPPHRREAGEYELVLTVQGEPAADSVVQLYTTRSFELLCEQPLCAGENAVRFTLPQDDKYFMIQIRSGSADALRVGGLALDRQ